MPTSLLSVLISWRSLGELDACALLLDATGQVRSEHDLVYFDTPRHPSQAVTIDQDPEPGTARLSVSLPRTEADITRILIAGSGTEADLGAYPGLTLAVRDDQGLIARADIAAEPGSRAAVFGEFRHTDGRWWFLAGYGRWSAIARLFTKYGADPDRISLRCGRTPAPPPPRDPGRADWHPAPGAPGVLRWWDGRQ
ncbi:MAG: TerD family protein, partial [Nocardia sp.]|nr:TerD family protein [Nocardia sp.]